MIYITLTAVNVGLFVYVQFLLVRLNVAEHDYESLTKYSDGMRDEIARLKSTIRMKQDSIESIYDEIETRCEEATSRGCC